MKTLFQHLLFWLLSPSLLFATAAVVPEVGGADGAVSGEAAPDAGDGTATDDGSGGLDTAKPETDAADSGKPEGAEAKPEGRTSLPPKVREMMEQLKTADPKAHGFLKDVLFRDRAFKQELPGGLPELKKLKETVAAIGDGGVEAIQAERSEWNAIDEAYNAADPRFLDIMVDANPDSFNKIAPLMLGKYAQTDPDGYQRHMAGIIATTLTNAGIGANLRFLARAIELGDKEGGSALLKEVTDFLGGISELAKSQPKAPDKNPDLDAREQRIKEAEDQQWVSQTASEVNSFKTSAIKKELAQYAKNQQIDDETYELIENQALKYVNAILMADPNFIGTFNKYCENKDRDGVSKFMRSRLQEILPSRNGKAGPVEKAFKLIFRGATPPSSKPAPRTPAGAKPGTAPAAPQGWAKVGKAPAPHEIDMKASPFEMRFKQAAVLKNGKKVFWGAQAPA